MSVPDELLKGMLTKLHLAPSEASSEDIEAKEERARRTSFAPKESVVVRGSFLAQINLDEVLEADDLSLAESLENIEKAALGASLENIERGMMMSSPIMERRSLSNETPPQSNNSNSNNSNTEKKERQSTLERSLDARSMRTLTLSSSLVRKSRRISGLSLDDVEELSDIEEDDGEGSLSNDSREGDKGHNHHHGVTKRLSDVAEATHPIIVTKTTPLDVSETSFEDCLPNEIAMVLCSASASKEEEEEELKSRTTMRLPIPERQKSNNSGRQKSNNTNNDYDRNNNDFEGKIGNSLACLGEHIGRGGNGRPLLERQRATENLVPRQSLLMSLQSSVSSARSHRSNADSFLSVDSADFAGDFWAWRSNDSSSFS